MKTNRTSNSETVNLSLDSIERDQLHSLLMKLDEFKSMATDKHLSQINTALSRQIELNPFTAEASLQAMQYVNQVFLFIGTYGAIAEKLSEEMDKEYVMQEENSMQEIDLQTA